MAASPSTSDMTGSKPRRKRVEVTARDARVRWAELLSRVEFAGDRFVITRHGRPVAVLESVEASV